ncbi:hypothetical protein GCM10027416_15960 [Okibacterium endophyticum]
MTNNPDEIRENIEATRRELGGDVDALADKVNPSKAVHRQTEKAKNALGSVKDRVMGVAEDAKDHVTSAAHDTSDAVGDIPHRAVEKARGNPLAVGLIAFGVGWLAASLIPSSDAEKKAAAAVKDAAQPLVHEAQEAAKGVAQNLKEPAQNAAQAVGDTAAEGFEHVRSEASSGADELRDEASRAKHSLQND